MIGRWSDRETEIIRWGDREIGGWGETEIKKDEEIRNSERRLRKS